MKYLLPLIILLLAAGPAWAQLGTPSFDPAQVPNAAVPTTVRPADTAVVRKPTARQRREQSAADSARRTEKLFGFRMTKPTKAGLLAIVPGGGQIYNHKYWKLPIVYGVVGGLGYWVAYNTRYFNEIRFARNATGASTAAAAAVIRAATDEIPNDILREQLALAKVNNPPAIDNALVGARRTLDLSILLSLAGYSLTALDAVVDAHLSEFDISDNLSLRWQPGLLPVPGQGGAVAGLTLTLHTR